MATAPARKAKPAAPPTAPPGAPPVAPPWAAPQPAAGPASPPAAPHAAQSGMLKAAVILLLVGAILYAAMAALLLGFALLFGVLFAVAGAAEEEPGLLGGILVAAIYGVWGLLAAAGAICGFMGWRRAARGDLDGGFVWGLVGSLLPPLNIVSLLGAIFLKVCPEHEAQERATRQAWGPPR